MYLPDRAIREFQNIWLEHYGEELPADEAMMIAERFLSGIHQMLTLADRAKSANKESDPGRRDEGPLAREERIPRRVELFLQAPLEEVH